MTVFSTNSIFAATGNSKYIKYSGEDLNVINGANTVNTLPLCGVKVNYEQYQRINVQIPKGQTDFVLSFPLLGIKTNFLTIKPSYCGVNTDLNYLKWKFQPSSDPKYSFTNILTLTGTSSNPIPPILIDNPNPDCAVSLDILVTAMENDYLNDTAAFLYLDGLKFDNIHTYNETNSEILSFFNKYNILAGTVDIIDIVNITHVQGQNRIIIDESSDNNIVLDFLTADDTFQALSAINWVISDPSTRYLPQAKDLIAPVITFTNKVNTVLNQTDIDLTLYPLGYNKLDFINNCILSVIDARDGAILITNNNITIKQGTILMNQINNPGIYTIEIIVSDLANNTTNIILQLEAHANIIDTNPPVINYTTNVNSGIITPFNISAYPSGFTINDAKVYCISNITDDIDGMIPLSTVVVTFKDIYQNTITSITTEGDYTITFSVADNALNNYTETLKLHVNDLLINSGPEIIFTNNANLPLLTDSISLSINYGSGIGVFTKADILTRYISSVTDDIDGTIILTVSDITIIDNTLITQPAILVPGIYTINFTAIDSALNTTIKSITLTVNL